MTGSLGAEPDGWSLAAAAARARYYRGLERRLFEVLGEWVPHVAEPETKLLLRAHSFQHAWHAELWDDLVPVGNAGGVGAGGVSAGGGGGGEIPAPVIDAVAGARETLERLVGVYRVVLPRLIGIYTARGEISPPVGGPGARRLRLMLADDHRACQEGEHRIGALIGDDEAAAERAHGWAGTLEAQLSAPLRLERPEKG